MTVTTSQASLRPIREEDRTFLRELYVATRTQEFVSAGLPAALALALLEQQFAARETSYATAYAQVEHTLVEIDGVPVGRVSMSRSETHVHLVDIAVLPERSDQGIGSALLRELLFQAGEAGLPVTLHVDVANPARRLYERLGFVTVSADDVRMLMRCDPPEAHHG